jgi:ATP-binding protein involved in chromosome partitioning
VEGSSEPVRVEPTENGESLRIVWADGHVSEYAPRDLRLNCRCAGCIDEFTGKPLLDPARVPADIHPTAIHYVGRYALAFRWSDGHDTGIYPFELLREIG